jgi:hypothetical protein
MAHLAQAEREYARSILAAVAGTAPRGDSLGYYARRTRIAASNAEAAVTRSLGEPEAHRIDADRALRVLEGFRRVSETLHALRMDLRARLVHVPVPEASQLAPVVDAALASITAALGSGETIGAEQYNLALVRSRLARDIDERVTLVQTDQLLEALDALAHVLRNDAARAVSG